MPNIAYYNTFNNYLNILFYYYVFRAN